MKAIIFIATVFLTLKCALSQSRYDEYDQYTPSDDRRHTVEVGDYYNQYQPRYSHPDSNYGCMEFLLRVLKKINSQIYPLHFR